MGDLLVTLYDIGMARHVQSSSRFAELNHSSCFFYEDSPTVLVYEITM